MKCFKYTHTHRFQSELIAYFLHFHQLQELVNHYRAAVIGETKADLRAAVLLKYIPNMYLVLEYEVIKLLFRRF